MATQRILKGTSASMSVTFYSDEAPIDADGEAVTVTVVGASGVTYATDASTNRTGVGVYRWTSVAMTAVDLLTLAFTGEFGGVPQTLYKYAEIVGGYYSSIAEIRESDPALSSVEKWPTAKLIAARAEAEDVAEDIMGRSWIERCTTERMQLRDGYVITRWDSVRSVLAATVDGVAVSAGELSDINARGNRQVYGNRIYGFWGDGATVDVCYSFGEVGPPPSYISRAIMSLTRTYAMANQSAIPDRADRYVTDMMGRTFYLATASADRTGYPQIDAVLQRAMRPAIA